MLRVLKSQIRRYWTVSNTNSVIKLDHEISGNVLQFPLVWLRDNCQCNLCFDSQTKSRIIPLLNLDLEIAPREMKVIDSKLDTAKLEINWPDGHVSSYQMEWLSERNFSKFSQDKWLKDVYKFEKRTWEAQDFEKLITPYDFQNIFSEEEELLKWLTNLTTFGVTIIKNAGKDEKQIFKLTDKIGFLKKTQYGENYVVQAKPDAKNVAYLPQGLQLHIDLPYYEYCPGVNLLHYITQSTDDGGQNQLVDAFHVCKILKKGYPHLYDILTKVLVEWSDIGEDNGYEFHNIHRAPVICENCVGEISRFNFSQPQRDSHFCVSLEDANNWYKAMKILIEMLHHQNNIISIKMQEGDILVFDNIRILHGRSGYRSNRRVIGGYIDWDIVSSKIRVLKNKYKK